jgi:putative intracellular protease/amidase
VRTLLRRAVRVAAVIVAVLLPAALTAAFGSHYAPGPSRPTPAAPPLAHDPAKPTAVVVVGDHGAEVSDVLAPYEILAATGRLNVYTVAAQRRPLPLSGGLDLVPDLTFDDLATRTGAADLVVVPALPDVGEASTAPVTAWLRGQADAGAMLLGVCNGSGVLASAGLLDHRPATAHWMRIGTFESDYPQVDWVRGERFVDDGDVVSTGGVLSGVDGTLHVVERLFGPAAAADAAAAVGWRHHGAGPPPPVSTGAAVPGPAALINAGYRWEPPVIGVVLGDGVGEIELASVFDVYGTSSLAARTLALTTDGGPVRSRHGMVFLPRAALAEAAPSIDRLLVPGAAAAASRPVAPPAGAPDPEYPHERPGFPVEAAVVDLARTVDVATARWAAKVVELPTDDLVLRGPAWPWAPTLVAGGLVLLGAAVAVVTSRGLRRRRTPASRGVGAR